MKISSSTFVYGTAIFGSFLLLNYIILYYRVYLPNFSLLSVRNKRILTTGDDVVDKFIVDEPGALRNREWEQLNRDSFYRRSMAYYFVDRSLLRVYSLSRNPMFCTLDDRLTSFKFMLFVKHNSNVYNLTISNVTQLYHDNRSEYDLTSLNSNLNLTEALRSVHNVSVPHNHSVADTFRIKLFIKDTLRNFTTHHSIDVKLLTQSRANVTKRGSMLCTYCYFYGQSETFDNYVMFLYWIELNKKFGYEKIGICNHSFPATANYNQLFAKHKDFVQMYELKFFPNLQLGQGNATDETHVYYTSFNQVHPELTVPLEVIMYNECYLDNFEHYRYVAINGADELVIPRTNAKFRKDATLVDYIAKLDLSRVGDRKTLLNNNLDMQAFCNVSVDDEKQQQQQQHQPIEAAPIVNYLSGLERLIKTKSNYEPSVNFHFLMGHYLKDVSIELILTAFDTYFNSKEYHNRTNSQAKPNGTHVISVVDTSYENFTYTFVLNDQYEINYLRNLAKIYKLLIGDFKSKHRAVLAKHLNQFNRFLYFSGNLTDFLCGKSIYNTAEVMAVSVHYLDSLDTSQLLEFDFKSGVGLDSHFRRQYSFEPAEITFDELKIDLNYYLCYYRHVLKDLLGLDVIHD